MTGSGMDSATARQRNAELIAAAIAYAKRGWRVIPLWWITTGLDGVRTCACYKKENCRTPGKHPLFKGWKSSATTNLDTIRFWWSKRPYSNLGLVMGGDARLVALDIDGEAGRESLAALEALHDALPTTWTQVSGRVDGGEHRVFAVSADLEIDALRNRVKISDGIDVRATGGGFIVVEPSEHVSGGRYGITINVQPADLPSWAFWIIADTYKAAKARMAIASAERPPEHELPSMQERLDRGTGICKRHPPAIERENGSATLMSLCVKLVRGLCLPTGAAFDLVVEHYNETCEPEWSDDEIMHKLSDAEMASIKKWRFVIDEEDVEEDEEASSNRRASADDRQDQPRRSPPMLDGPTTSPASELPSGRATTNVTAASLTDMILGAASPAGGPSTGEAVQPWRTPSGLNAPLPSTTPRIEPEPDDAPDRISIAPPNSQPKPFLSYATVEVLGSITKNGQHHLQLRVLDGRLRGLKKDDPLDWPLSKRSSNKWQHIGAALDIAISKPSDTYGKRFRAELLKRSDGVVEVHRSYPAIVGGIDPTLSHLDASPEKGAPL